jgi:antitoxin component of MazEF toxin-antitoxin module
MSLVKKLIRFEDSTAVILDPEILSQAEINTDSEVEVTVEDHAIAIRPHRYAGDNDARAAGRKVIRNRGQLLERLSK